MRLQLTGDWTEVQVIQLTNDGSGLGFGIVGGRSTGVVVKTILPGSPADRVRFNFLFSYQHFCAKIMFIGWQITPRRSPIGKAIKEFAQLFGRKI